MNIIELINICITDVEHTKCSEGFRQILNYISENCENKLETMQEVCDVLNKLYLVGAENNSMADVLRVFSGDVEPIINNIDDCVDVVDIYYIDGVLVVVKGDSTGYPVEFKVIYSDSSKKKLKKKYKSAFIKVFLKYEPFAIESVVDNKPIKTEFRKKVQGINDIYCKTFNN